jgi:hypothetical protein
VLPHTYAGFSLFEVAMEDVVQGEHTYEMAPLAQASCKVRFFFNLVSHCDVRVQSKSLVLKETSLY